MEAAAEAVADAGDDPPDLAPDLAALPQAVAEPDEPAPREEDEGDDPPEGGGAPDAGEDGIAEKGAEAVPHHRQEQEQDDDNGDDVPDPVDDHGAEHLVEGGQALPFGIPGGILRDEPAADHFAHAREDEVDEHADVHGVEAGQGPGRGVDRAEEHLPAEAAEEEDEAAQEHGDEDPFPAAFLQRIAEILPVDTPEGKVEQHDGNGAPEDIFQRIANLFLHSRDKFSVFSLDFV